MTLIQTVIILIPLISASFGCNPSVTKASGSKAPRQICSGQLLFEDNFDSLDKSKWKFENTMAGGGNWEFQWYPGHDSKNAYTKNGNLHIAPTTTASIFGENYLTSARVVIPADQCTWSADYGCDRTGSRDHIINPIRSAKMDTRDSFSFKYGTMEIRAKLPAGDWLWPALWMLPKKNTYGGWPRSGEIDLMESRGNRDLRAWNNQIGNEQVSSTLHFGPSPSHNGFSTAHFEKNRKPGYNDGFHLFKLVWRPNKLEFYVDNSHIGTVDAGNGFWDRAQLWNSGMPNPWANRSKMAPFDQEFYIIMNLAVGGTGGYFPDSGVNQPHPKPWKDTSSRAAAEFWEKKNDWLPGWNLGANDDSHLQVDYVKVWAL
ncbi:unnamed protein product [Chironomus riparius]|uniref:GH16 domain-containing protein n=1 Tax=Chironomus riparius TaxID=315576 RepID=A0A9N9RMA5_9DIPT|nr:unnamed protein product [Chironomus riparius]